MGMRLCVVCGEPIRVQESGIDYCGEDCRKLETEQEGSNRDG